MNPPNKRIYLSAPHMCGKERKLLLDAFDSNWIAPLGPHVDGFEREFTKFSGKTHAVALSSGTAALHLALLLVGVQPGDQVITSSLTFVATANAIMYCGATPIFIDSNLHTWNMDPNLLEDELADCRRRNALPKAVLSVDVNGQCCDYDSIEEICARYEVPLIEDAAESLGAKYKNRVAGSFGVISCFSFNGNKIITTSGGGMLATDREEWALKARKLSTQARDEAPHYEHSMLGFNYRMSNLLAAVGRGQLDVLPERVRQRRANFEFYKQQLGDRAGVNFMPEPEGFFSTHWLTAVEFDPKMFGEDRETIRHRLAAGDVEARPIWKPMHMQPIYKKYPMRGGNVSQSLFENGLCLPSGSHLTPEDLQRVMALINNA